MLVELPYGHSALKFRVDEGNIKGFLTPRDIFKAGNVEKLVRESLKNPIGKNSVPITELEGRSAAIAVTDSTRPTPNKEILPVLIRELREKGISYGKIKVIIATGLHRPDSEELIEMNVGREVTERVKVFNHDPDSEQNIYLGSTKNSTPLKVNKEFMEAEIKVVTGNITPCMLAGYSGGAKTILPGVSSRETIERNHSLFTKILGGLKRASLFGVLGGNLVREDMEEAASLTNVDMIVNTVLNHRKETVEAVAGGVVEAHREGVKKLDDFARVKTPGKADIVICSSGFKEHDVSLLQGGTRVFASVESIVRENGSIIYASPCYEGVSEHIIEHEKGIFSLKPHEILGLVEEGKLSSVLGCMIYEFSFIREKFNVQVVSDNITEKDLSTFGFEKAGNVDEALNTAFKIHGKGAEVLIVPYGSITIPVT